jgi:hypothetical protein
MDLLTEKVCLVRQQDFCALDLSEIKNKRRNLFVGCASRIGKTLKKVTKGSGLIYDIVENVFFIGLKWQGQSFCLPFLQVFEFRTSGITRDLSAPVTNRTGVLVKFLDFASRDL